MGAIDLAAQAAERSVERGPGDPSAWERLGRLRLLLADREGALDALRRALSRSDSAASMANDHPLIAFSNLDINLAKQITILLTDFGVKKENIAMDPLMAGLGMGLDYSYSVNERIRLAALMGDGMLQQPMLCDTTASWKSAEATDELVGYGETKERGVWWEATTAIAALVSGADILVMRHPGAANIVRETINELRGGN